MIYTLRTLALFATLNYCNGLEAGVITNSLDGGSGSLRAAIAAAINGETLTFAPGLNGATITLTSGELSITGLQLAIDASSLPNGIKISGNASSRIFVITGNANVSLNSLELLNGRSLNGNGGGVFAAQSQLNCVNTTIRNCVSSLDGGGLWANGTTGTMDRCSFIGNDSGSYGGGIFLIGATPWTILNSVITGNRSVIGGGIANLNSSPAIINCTIQGNSGSGIQLEFASAPNLRNTIVWGNRGGDGSIATQQIRNGMSSTAVANVDYCLVENVPGTLHNLDGTLAANDPKFIKPGNPVDAATPKTANSDLRVFTTSPVLNVGDNNANSASLDRSGRTRIQSVNIDLGAFEAGYVTFASLHPSLGTDGDSNGNGVSNFLEYAAGIDPSAPHDPSANPAISASGGLNYLTSTRRINGADISAFWETSTTLAASSWQIMVSGTDFTVESTSLLAPDRQQLVLKLSGGGIRRFFRQAVSNTH